MYILFGGLKSKLWTIILLDPSVKMNKNVTFSRKGILASQFLNKVSCIQKREACTGR